MSGDLFGFIVGIHAKKSLKRGTGSSLVVQQVKDLALSLLKGRIAAVVHVHSVAQELPHAADAAKKIKFLDYSTIYYSMQIYR